MKGWRLVFLIFLSLAALAGTIREGLRLTQAVYFWTLIRFLGHGSLLTYALLMIRFKGYNTRHEN